MAGPQRDTAEQTVSPDFTCPDRTVCLFPNDDYTGNYGNLPATFQPADFTSGMWFTWSDVGAGDPNPGSLNNNSGSSIWVYDHQIPVSQTNPTCLKPGQHVLYQVFGHFEEFYGDSTCMNSFTFPLP